MTEPVSVLQEYQRSVRIKTLCYGRNAYQLEVLGYSLHFSVCILAMAYGLTLTGSHNFSSLVLLVLTY